MNLVYDVVLQAGPPAMNYTKSELYFDRILILLVAVSFFFAVFIMVRRTWRWDWLGYSIASLLVAFGGVYVWTYLLSIRPDYSNLLWARWTVRIIVLVVALNFDAALFFTRTDIRPIDPVLSRLEDLAERYEKGLKRLEAQEGIVNRVTDANNGPPSGDVPNYSGPGDNSP